MRVGNSFPTGPFNGLAIVGEAPGKEEERAGKPFVGASGWWLEQRLAEVGIERSECYIGNVCQFRPPGNAIGKFAWDGEEIQSSLEVLRGELSRLKPNLILGLGNTPLKAIAGKDGITVHRGSLYQTPLGKYLGTYHPAAILRQKSLGFPFILDLQRATREKEHPSLILPQRNLDTYPTPAGIVASIEAIPPGSVVGFDIEGTTDSGLIACSIAISPSECFIVPLRGGKGEPLWTPGDEERILKALGWFVNCPTIGKVMHNGTYDATMLARLYGWDLASSIVEDTQLKYWEIMNEGDHSLKFVASIYTLEPYWKDTRTSDDEQEAWRYCCLDSAVTLEVAQAMDGEEFPREHYAFNLSLLPAVTWMQTKGLRWDREKAKAMLDERMKEIHELQWALNLEVQQVPGYADFVMAIATKNFLKRFQKDNQTLPMPGDLVKETTLKRYHPHLVRIRGILSNVLHQHEVSHEDLGWLSMLTETAFNCDSVKQVCRYLYDVRGYKARYSKTSGNLTCDESALLSLLKQSSQWKKKSNEDLKLILKLRQKRTATEKLTPKLSQDKRLRCSMNLTGTPTGRMSMSKTVVGEGFNLQTVPEDLRCLCLADDGHWFFQVDLNGADGWTIAAHALKHGDPNMWEDNKAGFKPAWFLWLAYHHGPEVGLEPRDRLKAWAKEEVKKDWLYDASKATVYGSSFQMGGVTMSNQILANGYAQTGELTYVPPAECEKLQDLFFRRYPGIKAWQREVARKLKHDGRLTAASGQTRRFFNATERDALAQECQANTTYCTHLALQALWQDPENWQDGQPVIQPLVQVHDALCGQFPKDRTQWAVAKLREYFNKPLTIAGQEVTIPYEGGYGPSWGELTEGSI